LGQVSWGAAELHWSPFLRCHSNLCQERHMCSWSCLKAGDWTRKYPDIPSSHIFFRDSMLLCLWLIIYCLKFLCSVLPAYSDLRPGDDFFPSNPAQLAQGWFNNLNLFIYFLYFPANSLSRNRFLTENTQIWGNYIY